MPQTDITRLKGMSADVDGFAIWALALLAQDARMTSCAQSTVTDLFVDLLYHAVSAPDRLQVQGVLDKMLASGLSPYDVADTVIPKAAARLGEAWCADNIDFAVTTIGSARLQGLLRSLGPEWCADHLPGCADAPRCLVVVPEGAQHTLGATILTGQLRRAGLSVTLELNACAQNVADTLAGRGFDAVLVSASARESIEAIRKIVQKVHQTGRDVPVIVGGNVLSLDDDIAGLTGADLATSDLQQVMSFCGFAPQTLRVVPAP